MDRYIYTVLHTQTHPLLMLGNKKRLKKPKGTELERDGNRNYSWTQTTQTWDLQDEYSFFNLIMTHMEYVSFSFILFKLWVLAKYLQTKQHVKLKVFTYTDRQTDRHYRQARIPPAPRAPSCILFVSTHSHAPRRRRRRRLLSTKSS